MLAALWRATPTRTLSSQTHFALAIYFFLFDVLLFCPVIFLFNILSFLCYSCFLIYFIWCRLLSLYFLSLNYFWCACWCRSSQFSTPLFSVICMWSLIMLTIEHVIFGGARKLFSLHITRLTFLVSFWRHTSLLTAIIKSNSSNTFCQEFNVLSQMFES